ncbi:MAG TPA: ABC transporter substrate-binding protein [Hyphomicrobiales bacterium]|nr:ABC transporter substrate-binding protein [Hyphomicrobiales bacterium]
MTLRRKSCRAGALAGLVLLTLGGAAAAEPGVTKDQILVGSSLDLSGPAAPVGGPMKQALEIGAQMINDHGGINGRALKVITYDNALSVPKGLLAVQKLLTQDHVFAFVALMGEPLVQAAEKRIFAADRAIMFPLAGLQSLYDPPQRLLAAFVPDFSTQFAAGAEWALKDLQKRKICLLESHGMNANVRTAVEKVLASHQLRLTDYASYALGEADLSAPMARFKDAGCETVLLDGNVRDAAAALRERRKLDWTVDFLVAQSAAADGLIKLGGTAAEGTYGLATKLPMDATGDMPVVKELERRYRAAYDKPFDPSFLGGYQALALFAEAARRAGPDLTTATLIQGLDRMKDVDTGIGFPPVTFSESRRLGSDHGYIIQIRHGAWTKAADW